MPSFVSINTRKAPLDGLLRRRLLAGAVLITALLVATGCAGAESTGEPSTGSGGAFPRTVTHVLGSTEIPAEPTRIMALDQTFVDAALALDTAVVGFTDIRGSDGVPPPYLAEPMAQLAPAARSVGDLASPSLEQIAALTPDLIFSAKIRHEGIYDKLSRIAPTVFSETTGATWKENLQLLAQAIGKEDLARTRLAEYEQRAGTIGDAIRAAEGKNPTITVIRFSDMQTRLYQRASFSGIVLADTGLARPPSQDVDAFAAEFSQERILDADADHIFYTIAEGDSAPVRDRFTSNPLWSRLTGEIHEASNDVWLISVGLLGAHALLDDLAETFGVDPAAALKPR
ncbi:MAG: ABC transporter substrate-binding protein [Pseudonocardiaceae bacterium]